MMTPVLHSWHDDAGYMLNVDYTLLYHWLYCLQVIVHASAQMLMSTGDRYLWSHTSAEDFVDVSRESEVTVLGTPQSVVLQNAEVWQHTLVAHNDALYPVDRMD